MTQQSSTARPPAKRTLAPILRHEVRHEHLKMVLEHRRRTGFDESITVVRAA